jgi:hypothetical protein
MRDDPRELLWQNLARQFSTPTERLVCYCTFVLQMSPRMLYAHCPEHFSDITNVYAVKRTVLGRLHNDATSELS